MEIFRSIGVSSRAWLSVLRVSFRPTLWLPFLVVAAAQLGVLALFMQFHHPYVMPLTLPVIELTANESATHYPVFFFTLPEILAKVGLFQGILLESICVAVATLLFANAFGMKPGFAGRERIFKSIPQLILATAIPAAVIYGIGKTAALLPQDTMLNNTVLRWSVRAGYLLALTLVQCFVAYAVAWIVLKQSGGVAALRDSARVTTRTFLPTFIVIGVPVLLLFPFHYIVRRSDLFLNKLSPETIGGILAARSLVELVLGFMVVGAITRLFLWRMEAPR